MELYEKIARYLRYCALDTGQMSDGQLTFHYLARIKILQDMLVNEEQYVRKFVHRYFNSDSKRDSTVRRATGSDDGVVRTLTQVAGEYGVSSIDTSKVSRIMSNHRYFWKFVDELIFESGMWTAYHPFQPDYLRDGVLSPRVGLALAGGCVKSLAHLQYDLTEEEVLGIRGIGKKGLDEINRVLINKGGRSLPKIRKTRSKQLTFIRQK